MVQDLDPNHFKADKIMRSLHAATIILVTVLQSSSAVFPSVPAALKEGALKQLVSDQGLAPLVESEKKIMELP